jgi:CRP-like cAMP-binding protein
MARRDARTHAFDGVPFFDGCDERLLAELAPHADRVRVPAGTVLATAGRHAWQLLVLVEGSARTTDRGRTGILGPGRAIAPDAVATLAPFPATVTTSSEAEVLVVNGPAFVAAARQHPRLARRSPVLRTEPPAITATDPGRRADGGRARRRARRLLRARDRASAPQPSTRPDVPTVDAGPAPSPGRGPAVHARNAHVVAGIGR